MSDPRQNIRKAVLNGFLSLFILLGIYFGAVTSISGWDFARSQFLTFWYFLLALALGFGAQVGLYTYLKQVVKTQNVSGKMLATTGTTSTLAMVSCCSHYLINILPVLGVSGFLTLASLYQIQFFWLGLAFNLGGIAYLTLKLRKILI